MAKQNEKEREGSVEDSEKEKKIEKQKEREGRSILLYPASVLCSSIQLNAMFFFFDICNKISF